MQPGAKGPPHTWGKVSTERSRNVLEPHRLPAAVSNEACSLSLSALLVTDPSFLCAQYREPSQNLFPFRS